VAFVKPIVIGITIDGSRELKGILRY